MSGGRVGPATSTIVVVAATVVVGPSEPTSVVVGATVVVVGAIVVVVVGAIVVVVVIGEGFVPLVLTLGLLSWPIFMRVVYAEASSLYARDYVKAAQIAGVGRGAIMLGHVLPGLRTSLLAIFALHFATLLIAESALSFLGVGAPLGVPTWGAMLAESREYVLVTPRLLLVPAGAIILAVITATLLGDGLSAQARRRGGGFEP